MHSEEGQHDLASLQQSIRDSEASLRQMRQTINVVDARLKRSHGHESRESSAHEQQGREQIT